MEYFDGKILKFLIYLYNRISDGYFRNLYMLSKEYVIGMIKYLIENGLVMIEG